MLKKTAFQRCESCRKYYELGVFQIPIKKGTPFLWKSSLELSLKGELYEKWQAKILILPAKCASTLNQAFIKSLAVPQRSEKTKPHINFFCLCPRLG